MTLIDFSHIVLVFIVFVFFFAFCLESETDLLDMMLNVRYEDGSSMPLDQLRDEAMTFVLAGHESMLDGLILSCCHVSHLSDSSDSRLLKILVRSCSGVF